MRFSSSRSDDEELSSDEEAEITFREKQQNNKDQRQMDKRAKQLTVQLKRALSTDLLPRNLDKASKIRLLYRRQNQDKYKSEALHDLKHGVEYSAPF